MPSLTPLTFDLCPVLRVIPNPSLSSLTVNRPLCAKLINHCFCPIGNSFFQGITPSLCVTHVLGQFVTDLLGSYHMQLADDCAESVVCVGLVQRGFGQGAADGYFRPNVAGEAEAAVAK